MNWDLGFSGLANWALCRIQLLAYAGSSCNPIACLCSIQLRIRIQLPASAGLSCFPCLGPIWVPFIWGHLGSIFICLGSLGPILGGALALAAIPFGERLLVWVARLCEIPDLALLHILQESRSHDGVACWSPWNQLSSPAAIHTWANRDNRPQ